MSLSNHVGENYISNYSKVMMVSNHSWHTHLLDVIDSDANCTIHNMIQITIMSHVS